MDNDWKLSRAAMVAVVLLRVAIGWHFLYEGVAKLQKPSWSAAGYLQQSKGVLAELFKWMAASPSVLEYVNPLNMWGLTLIGLGLILGCFTRLSAAAGMLIVLMYYLANPPWVGYFYSIPMEGSYLIVNKNLVEIAALAVIFFTGSGRVAGLDRVIHRLIGRRTAGE